ncbi:hypothetical protein [Duganella violaceipulchra]|uniref:Uncharacterized protein n=1 Tax=Duganella violaceipulchra TaxID=2849652 RepID=A0AA41L6R6_9BURK|nr:hypothetical protein [Duganella violaceicalia]MBV6325539.1 hypothetical protein [Duganella violaceicalia]MCP2012120.1 hypothetical protein [Duganella violaceicalia]
MWRGSDALFDTLLVFENYPRGTQRREEVLGASDYGFSSQTHYPLSVIVTGGAGFTIDFGFDPSRFHLEDIHTMGHLE